MKPCRKNVVTNRTTLERAVALAIYFVCTHNVGTFVGCHGACCSGDGLLGQKFVLAIILTVHGRVKLSV
jgi:hypothetical protein